MNKLFTLIFALFLVAGSQAQISQGGSPERWDSDFTFDVSQLPKYESEALDMDLIRAQDEISDQLKDVPYRFGIELETSIDVRNEALYEEAGNGDRIYYYMISCPDAESISMVFDQFELPVGAELYIWNSDRTDFIGAFTSQNNKEWGSFAVGVVHGDQVILEYHEPYKKRGQGALNIGTVIHGYRSILERLDAVQEEYNRGPFGNSGACNIGVNCPEGADWQVEKRSVALIVDGGFASCSGALVNNTAQDGTPYFLTANHCLGGQNNWVFYFNHEAPENNCDGNSGPTNQSISGSTLRASSSASDFALLELSQNVPNSFNPQFVGWDNSDDETVTSAVGIHHPSGDLKKICFEDDAPFHNNTAGAAVWFINQWEDGVTEGGSSGSPLFDQNHRIIGQLYGGAAACQGNNNNGQFDYYGRFGVSWDGNSSSTRLRDWLDPLNLGVSVLDGWPEGAEVFALDAAAGSFDDVDNQVCDAVFAPVFSLFNSGSTTISSVTVNYTWNGAAQPSFNWTGNLAQNQSELVYLPTLTGVGGTNTLEVTLTAPNGGNDEDLTNNTLTTSYEGYAGATVEIVVSITTDDYGSETTWTVTQGGTTFGSGGPYSNDTDGQIEEKTLCLPAGCYQFNIFDSYGDGICCGYGEGQYRIVAPQGIIAFGGEFSDDETITFCTDDAVNVNEVSEVNFTLYPNPADDKVSIELPEGVAANSIQLVNNLGQVILDREVNQNNTINIDLSEVARGWYTVRVIDGNSVLTQKLIIQ